MVKKKVQVLYWIDMGMFPATVLFSCGFSYDELVKELKKKKANDWLTGLENTGVFKEATNCASQVNLENTKSGKKVTYYYIVLKNSFTFTDRDYCVLAHEILHICQFFLPTILNRDREFEGESYLHTYLMEQCLKILRGPKKAKKA